MGIEETENEEELGEIDTLGEEIEEENMLEDIYDSDLAEDNLLNEEDILDDEE